MPDDSRYQRGLAKVKQIFGEAGEQAIAHIAQTSPDLARHIVEFVFAEIVSRGGLDLKSRETAAVAALTALGHATPQLRVHIHGALNVGCSQQEVIEIIIQVAVYAGFPAAINALSAAREVFAERAAK